MAFGTIHLNFRTQSCSVSCIILLRLWTAIRCCGVHLVSILVMWQVFQNLWKIFISTFCVMKIEITQIIEKCIAGKECTLKLLSQLYLTFVREQYFRWKFNDEVITILFEARKFANLPSELVFAESILMKIELSSLTYGIVNIYKRITYINNEVLTSRHDCVFGRYTCDMDLPKKLACCILYTRYCSMYPKNTCPFYILYCAKNLIAYLEKLHVTANCV